MGGFAKAIQGFVTTLTFITVVSAQQREFSLNIDQLSSLVLDAIQKAQYTGKRVVEYRDGLEQKRLVEKVSRAGSKIRIEFEGQSPYAGQIIVESNQRRLHYFPDRREIVESPSHLTEAIDRIARVWQEIKRGKQKVILEQRVHIAGRETQPILISNFSTKQRQRIWVDIHTGVVLKREVYDNKGNQKGYFEFQNINYNPPFRKDVFDLTALNARRISIDERLISVSSANGIPAFRIPKTQPYLLLSVRPLNIANKKAIVQQYRHGRNRTTLYIFHGEVNENRLKRLAPRNVKVHVWKRGRNSFVLLGDNDNELARVASLVH